MRCSNVYKPLFILQSVCIIVYIANQYLQSQAYHGHATKSLVAQAENNKRDVNDSRVHHDAVTDIEASNQHANVVATRGRLSDCYLADVRKKPGVVLLTTTNTAFLDVTLNMLESIRRTGVCVNITIIAEDEKAYKYLHMRAGDDPAIHIIMTDSGETTTKKLMVFTAVYNKLVNKRQRYLLNLLERGLDVLFSDADTFWFRDPFPYFQGDFDVAMLDEKLNYPERNEKSVFCAGFAYYKPTERTLQFVKSWVQTLKDSKKVIPDQNIMNDQLLNDKPVHMEVRSLNPVFFPKGGLFYRKGWRQKNNDTVVMHSSMVFGHDKKVQRFKENHMWLVNTTVLKELPR